MSLSDPLAKFDLVALNEQMNDPAIDRDNEEAIEKYAKSCELEDAPLKQNIEPTLFHCQPLPPVLAISALSGMSPGARNMYAFVAGCHLVKMPGGVEIKAKKLKTQPNGVRAADDDWVNECSRRFGADTVDEIGRAIYYRARLPEKKAPRSE